MMSIEDEGEDIFFDRYNAELHHIGCGARVAASVERAKGLMAVVDLDGKTIGDLPKSIEPNALAAVMLLVEQSFEEGVKVGRGVERSAT